LVSYDKNPSEIRVFPMTGLNDEYTQLRIIKNSLAGRQLRKHGIVFIIFGKDRINRIVDTLAPSGSFSSSPRKNLSASLRILYMVSKMLKRLCKLDRIFHTYQMND